MNINQVINNKKIFLDVDVETKTDLFKFAANQLYDLNLVSNKEKFVKALLNREELSPTGMGDNWAIPHGQDDSVKAASVLYIRTKKPIVYESLEGNSADKFFFIAVPSSTSSDHVKILSKIATLLMEDEFKKSMSNIKNKEDIMTLISNYSDEQDNEYSIKESKNKMESNEGKKVVAVTACTTGIAHTYMAEKALDQAARELNIDIFIEKQGAAGVEDALTFEQIEEADVVVLAIEKGINETRFAGKDILKVSPGKAIKEGKNVLLDALNKKSTYIKTGVQGEEVQSERKSAKGVYQHLLAGVSYMIPIVVAGGLAIALSFAFGITAFENEGSLAWALYEIGSNSAMALMFPVLAGFISYDIADKSGFAPGIIGGFIAHNTGSGFVGAILAGYLAGYVALFINKKVKFPESIRGLKNIVVIPVVTTIIVGLFLIYVIATPVVAIQGTVAGFLTTLSTNNAGIVALSLAFSIFYFDLGGPISKMVYAFAVSLLSSQIYSPMAAVMIIGMIPPLSMGIATMVRPNMFKEDQQEAGKTATLLGMSFITEGALPFAIAYPKQAIPSFMLGGFVGSVISLAFNIGVTAPHGGLFLVLIPNAITNPLLFVLALGVGSVVSAISMVTLMKLSVKSQLKKANLAK
ncbi:PTS system D-fructose-specific IIB component (F1P-forming), Frc family /PTS system D-fructose-specific IIC component (F1P-forming), Frc family [Carnobacterium alterfunditum]|uniref:PTS system D-fructose-specific IIB component (F1P-forming), Frc family /PTS system D-fructose-specific IIC component (F1P-forming), Frc family n=1 Tax=Carnobacterium alterfunditum TaxID=28230 RepID=A0A1N6IJU9_9LACT|nr:fructose-specific PTS transporter subunit EIIC [Carnobacterium alterfunditum]SIO32310.1 PTS system D-fructose-specific IIB component (F1P-forming), Frc family /PTS system D-fructose-specific IIC component (F1P-forming), Frc family [Carnobacterium alterfunditum]